MLNPNQDRLDYGQILSPPEGFSLDFAVGTTYSLDLDALVGATIALGLSEETDSALLHNPICLLEALRRVGDKVALFTEAGQIHMPNTVTPLYVLLEKMVFQVAMPKHRGSAGYPSFHPKFWLIRYTGKEKEILYRVIVLSRNLTFDRSWDVTFAADGYLHHGEKTDKNKPVADFLKFLTGFLSDAEKNKKLSQIARELPKVFFDLESKEFYDFDFIPIGISRKTGGYPSLEDFPLFRDTFQELMIMSPFLSKGVIQDFNTRYSHKKNPEYMLITRESSLNKLKKSDCSNFSVYTLRNVVVDGESAISEDGVVPQQQDIHAKVYMTRNSTKSDLYLGSMNASHNAISGNVEFMICLHSRSRYLNLDILRSQLFCGGDDAHNPFQLAEPQEDIVEADMNSILTQVIRELARMDAAAEVTECDGSYNLTVHISDFHSEYSVFISPLLSKKTSCLEETVVFKELSVVQISEFYKITVSDGENQVSRVLLIPTSGIPENREKEIIAGVVNTKSSFYQYISFLLGDSYALTALERENSDIGGNSQSRTIDMLPPLYEKMLRTAAENPERLKEIGSLIEAVSEDGVIPEHFNELYTTFQKAVNLDA